MKTNLFEKSLELKKLAAHHRAHRLVSMLSFTEINNKIKTRGGDLNQNRKEKRIFLINQLTNEMFLIDAVDMFLWNRKELNELAHRLGMHPSFLINDSDDTVKKTLVYQIAVQLANRSFIITPDRKINF